jgi:aminoglycoside/choline kinase family phosphotransferase
MSALRPELAAALSRLYPGSRHETLAGDASNRRFHRLFLADGATRIVMDYGASFDRETDDVRLARIFDDAGVRVARVIDVLAEAGALVEEDLGDETLETALARAASGGAPGREGLYRSAVALAADIASKGTASLVRSDRAAGPALDDQRFRFEMNFFLEHYVGSFLGRPEVASDIRPALEALASDVASHPRVLCHRDYHCRNIMVADDGTLALVDIQDARWGPDTYDLASLLRDAYVDLGDAEVDTLFDAYSKRFAGASDRGARRARFELVSAQRMIKALGTFGYQVAVLGRDRYRSAVPRTVNRLARLLPARPMTAALAETLGAAGLLST